MNPEVSIIIPTYNRVSYLGETLDSLIQQVFQNWECIVVDDGSSDYTVELMEFYSQKDNRFQYHHRPADRPKGANSCRNYGFSLSRGGYIQYLDSDDLLSKKKINEQYHLIKGKSASIATSKWGVFRQKEVSIYQNLKSYSDADDPRIFLQRMYRSYGYFPPHAYLISRNLIEIVGGWNEYLKINQDGEFMIRIICNARSFRFAKNSHVLYRLSRQDSTSVIGRDNIHDHYHCLKLIESYLQIRFKEDMIPEFEIVKRRAFIRIPDSLNFIYKNEKSFFYYLKKEKKNRLSLTAKLKKKIKAFLR